MRIDASDVVTTYVALGGGYGDDLLIGGHKDDVIRDSPGNDILIGGEGDDHYLLGVSPDGSLDILYFGEGSGDDQVGSFRQGSDKIQIDVDGVSRFADLTISYSTFPSGYPLITVSWAGGASIEFNAGPTTLLSTDFIFGPLADPVASPFVPAHEPLIDYGISNILA